MDGLDLPAEKRDVLRQAIIETFNYGGAAFRGTQAGVAGLEAHLTGRMSQFQKEVIPWLSTETSFLDARILEIGAGSGSSTAVLSKAGAAHIDAIDIAPGALGLAKLRCELYDLPNVDFHLMNATELDRFSGQLYELVIFFACLEHMTYAERKVSLPLAWSLVRPGGLLCVIDTPNRLWYMDRHTSLLPFFHWLPDEVAVDYADRIQRPDLVHDLRSKADQTLQLARLGRGVSYHDFDLSIGQVDGLNVSGMGEYYRRKDPAWGSVWGDTMDGRFHAFLCSVAPHVPPAFFEEGLDLVIRK